MAEVVPPIPYKTPLITRSGFLSDPWSRWFNSMFSRIGGTNALSNLELEELPALELAAVQASITALAAQLTSLQATVADHTSDITNLQSGLEALSQGPNL